MKKEQKTPYEDRLYTAITTVMDHRTPEQHQLILDAAYSWFKYTKLLKSIIGDGAE